METRASYFLVGSFALAILAGLFVTIVWMTKFDRDPGTRYYIYFTTSVTGLQSGSAVRLRGVPVGQVTDISIDSQDTALVQVTVSLKTGTPVKVDTRASIQPQGITGLVFIQLTGGSRDAEELKPPEGKLYARIPADPSAFDAILMDVPRLLAQAGDVAQRVIALLGDDNQKSIAASLANVARFAETLGTKADDFGKLVGDASAMIGSLRQTASALEGVAQDLGKSSGKLTANADAAIGDLRKAMVSIERLATDLDRIARDSQGPVRNFTQVGLYELTQFLAESRALVQRLARISVQFERDPARFLFGDQSRGIEAR